MRARGVVCVHLTIDTLHVRWSQNKEAGTSKSRSESRSSGRVRSKSKSQGRNHKRSKGTSEMVEVTPGAGVGVHVKQTSKYKLT